MKRRNSRAAILTLLLAASLATTASHTGAQAAGWTRLGNMPAATWEMAADGANSNTMYSLGEDGLSKTTDSGASWTICNRDARAITALTPLPGQPGATLLYATTRSGLRTSEDGCRTWKDVPGQDIIPSSAHVRWLAAYPNNRSVLYAGMDGLGGLYRSTDAGSSWKAATQGLPPGSWATTLAADPAQPQNLLLGLEYTSRNHPSSYVYRSTDGGLTWRSSSMGLYIMPNNGGYVNGLAWSGSTLFASTVNDGLYASSDQGTSWHAAITPAHQSAQATSGGPGVPGSTPARITYLQSTWDGLLILGTTEGAFQSVDGGRSWQSFGPETARGKLVSVALDRNSGQALLGSGAAVWGYKVAGAGVTLPTPVAPTKAPSPPTPPPPPILPTSTRVPPTATPTGTPVPPTPKPSPVTGYKPSDPARLGDSEAFTFFPQTNHNLGHGFRDFWQANGGIAQFGYPITEEFVENGVSVQYFERARLEYVDGTVSVGRVGAELTAGTFFRPIPFFPSVDDNVYFGTTGHSIEGPFLNFWRNNGRDVLLGYPISQSFKDDGSEYQWFERARIEWHPYLPEGERIVLGNIGVEALRKKGWLP